MLTAEELVSKSTEVVSLPEIYLRIRQILDDPTAGMDEVAEVIARDPGFASRVLQIANSAFYGFPAKIDTVRRAANLLGATKIHDLVLTTTVCRAFDRISVSIMNMDLFWQNSIYVAVLSQLLAAHYERRDSDSLFIQGLLADVGHLIMYQQIPEQCSKALEIAKREQTALPEIERGLLGFDYAEVGGLLLQTWNLPETLCCVVGNHLSPVDAGECSDSAALVKMALQIAHSADPDIPLSDRECELEWQALELETLSDESCSELRQAADKAAQESLALIYPGHNLAA